MDLPEPKVGLVIRYAYLWREEALAGRDEGRKDRPCVILLVGPAREGGTLVTVAPITHTPPDPERRADAIALPAPTQLRLGLDGERSWVLASDLNQFVWPGFDLRPIRRGGRRSDLVPAPERPPSPPGAGTGRRACLHPRFDLAVSQRRPSQPEGRRSSVGEGTVGQSLQAGAG